MHTGLALVFLIKTLQKFIAIPIGLHANELLIVASIAYYGL